MTYFSKPYQPDNDSRVDRTLARIIPVWEMLAGRVLPAWLVRALTEFLAFGIKQAWACLFGGLMLAGIIATAFWPEVLPVARYDLLFLWAIMIQTSFLLTRLERPREALVILIFHIVGTGMELFKTAAGSWVYPEESVIRLAILGGSVPLFSGFMYAAVGSYLARTVRTFDFRFTHYPPRWATVLLAVLIYLNFFTHHYLPDIRYALFALAAILYGRTVVHYRVWRWQHRMPLLLGFFLVALFIWLAENIATAASVWLYPDQREGWRMVSFSKMGSWYLLMLISWVLVTLVHRPRRLDEAL